MQKKIMIILVICSLLFIQKVEAQKNEAAPETAVATANAVYSINLDNISISKGYTVNGFNELKLSLIPGILKDATPVEIIRLDENFSQPWNLERISSVYQFEFKNKKAYDDKNPFYVQFSYKQVDNYHKQVYFYDKNFSAWRPLPTQDFPQEKFVRSLIHLPYARLAIFSDHSLLTVGHASWYEHREGDFAASPDFPAGTKLRVYNLDNGKYVDVIINDFGPERKLHPDRVVDLDKIAFAKIADLSAGIANIKIEILKNSSQTSHVQKAFGNIPEIKAKSAIVYNENTKSIIYNKNIDKILPLASLTKLLAIKVFLDTRPTLSQIVTYKQQDAEYNYQWCQPWESAKLTVKEGEEMTVEDLLYTSLVGSANNTVESLVRVSGYTRKQFIAKMNETARSIGATSTYFIEPTGLSPDNVTTANDYALIAAEVFQHPIIEKASKMPIYKFTTINAKNPHTIKNTNTLVRYGNFNNYAITGSKTGYLDEAGYCLLLRAKNNDKQNLLVMTFGENSREQSLRDTEDLLIFGLKK
jgi:D-alanyl-D-alanine endopeptidase (penicillin-binding protein 7)